MTITSTQFLLLLEPGLRNIWHESWPPRELQYTDILNIQSMQKATETDAKLAGFGPLTQQDEGEQIIYQDPTAAQTKEYTYIVKASGYKVTDRMRRDELYGQVERWERDLMSAVRDDQEVAGFGLLNNGFTTTNTGFDGLGLFSTAHTRLDGGTNQLNRPSTDIALSLSALHDAVIQYRNWRNDRGRPFQSSPKLLVVPPDQMMVADELLNSAQKPGTADNDINAITRFGLQYKVVDYLTSTTAWFLLGDNHDLNFLWRFQPESGSEIDFDTDIIKRKVRQGYATGFGEWRGTYGTTGT
jgi:phage major head subunit gpT-like protein